MLLRELMTRNVEFVGPHDTLREAARKMRQMDIGSLPVCESDELVGIITDRDIAVRAVAEGQDPNRAQVRDSMTDQIIYCYEDEDIVEAARTMEEHQIRRLPIFNRDQKLVGFVSLGDLATRIHDDLLCGEVLEKVSEPVMAHV